MMNLQVIKADITKQTVDAIVNAANSSLLGGGGVDGAIHRAAGPRLLEACRKLKGCPTGSAKITKAYDLPAKYVIHAVGPVWRGAAFREKECLRSCYLTAMDLAEEYCCQSLAFPNISTGVYRFPKLLAAEIVVETIKEHQNKYQCLKDIYFVCFDDENLNIYQKLLSQIQ